MMTAALDSPDTDAGNGRVSSQGETTDQSMKSASSAMQNISISTPAMKGERAWLESAVQSICECCNFNFFHILLELTIFQYSISEHRQYPIHY